MNHPETPFVDSVSTCGDLYGAGAIASMQQSSRAAVDCLKEHGATCCTDVSGFGLLGHLQEVALASQVGPSSSHMTKILVVMGRNPRHDH